MPDDVEIDTDKLHETIHEEVEKEEHGSLLRTVALTTAVFAAIAAIAALQAGDTVNEALELKTEAARKQAEASNQWAYYQAKGVKGAVAEASRNAWLAAGKEPPEELAQNAERYAREQKDITAEARKIEKERDEKSDEGDRLMRHHRFFADSVALLQVAIALGAVAALTHRRLAWFVSLLLGAGGTGIFLWAALFTR